MPIVEGIDVAAEQAFQRLIEKKFQVESPAIGEGDDEAGELPEGAADADLAEGSPVGLGLLAWKDRETEEGLARDRARLLGHPPNLAEAALVTAVAQHFKEPAGSQMRMLFESLLDEVEPWIEERRFARSQIERGTDQRTFDGLRMEPHFGGDRADLPVLGIV